MVTLPCYGPRIFGRYPTPWAFFWGGEEEPLACGYFIILYIAPLGFLLRLKSLVLLSIYDVEKPLSCGGARQRLIRRIRWGRFIYSL